MSIRRRGRSRFQIDDFRLQILTTVELGFLNLQSKIFNHQFSWLIWSLIPTR